jgi:hypothetical protein
VLPSATTISRQEPQTCTVSLTCSLRPPAYACSLALLQASLAKTRNRGLVRLAASGRSPDLGSFFAKTG